MQLCPAQSISALIVRMKMPVMTEIGHVTRAAVLTGVGMSMVAEVGCKMRNMNA